MEIIHGKTYYEAPAIFALRDLLIFGQEKFSDRTCVGYRNKASDVSLIEKSYADLYQDVLRMQKAMSGILEPGSKVALIGDNSYQWMVSYLAVAAGFGTIVPLDRLLKHEELAPMLARSGAKLVIYDLPFHNLMQSLRKENDQLSASILIDNAKVSEESVSQIRAEHAADPGFHFFSDLLENTDISAEIAGNNPADALWPAHQKDETAAILFTSGTSASAKAVMLTEQNICSDIRSLLGSVSFPDRISALSVLPLHHTFENTCGFLSMLAIGAQINISDGLRYVSANLKEHQTYIMIAVPALLKAMKRGIELQAKKQGRERKLRMGLKLARFLRNIGIDQRRNIFKDVLAELGGNLQIIISGAASLDKETLRFFDALGIDVLQGYGLTEASPVVAGGNTRVNVLGTVGQPIAGITVAIDNEKDGEPGEILVFADSVMKGYLDDDAASKEAIDEAGWLHTGDIGRAGRRNTITITGRSKSMIVLESGKKVFPEELEDLLKRNDLIKDSLVFGHKTGSGDVVITAKLVLDEDKFREHMGVIEGDLNEDTIKDELVALIEQINSGLPSFKNIRSYFYSFQDMLQTTTMKVRRGKEMERLQEIFERSKASWQAIRGKNIDKYSADSSEASSADPDTEDDLPGDRNNLATTATADSDTLDKMKSKQLKHMRRKLQRDLRLIGKLQTDIEKRRHVLAEYEQELKVRQAILEQRLNKLRKEQGDEALLLEIEADLYGSRA